MRKPASEAKVKTDTVDGLLSEFMSNAQSDFAEVRPMPLPLAGVHFCSHDRPSFFFVPDGLKGTWVEARTAAGSESAACISAGVSKRTRTRVFGSEWLLLTFFRGLAESQPYQPHGALGCEQWLGFCCDSSAE